MLVWHYSVCVALRQWAELASGELHPCLCLLITKPSQYPVETCARYLEVLVILCLSGCVFVCHLANITGPRCLFLPRRCQQHHGEWGRVWRLHNKLKVQLTEHLTTGFSCVREETERAFYSSAALLMVMMVKTYMHTHTHTHIGLIKLTCYLHSTPPEA